MNGKKIFGTILAVAVMVFMLTPIASAQQYAGILNGQWFKANMTAKGYQIADDGETVLGKGAGSLSAYLYFSYSGPSYTIKTCMQNDLNDNVWHKNTSDPILMGDIYGVTYPQVWDFQDIPLVFSDGISTLSFYLTFFTKITADKANPAVLKTASISNVACAVYLNDITNEYGTGSCTLNGPLIPAANVAKKVPAACIAP
jgi:hypothetical protein